MWSPDRLSRQPSYTHSIAGSVSSGRSHHNLSRTSSFAGSDTNTPGTTFSEHEVELWGPKKTTVVSPGSDLRRLALGPDDSASLGEPVPPMEHDGEYDEDRELKTPKAVSRKLAFATNQGRARSSTTVNGPSSDDLLPSSTFSPSPTKRDMRTVQPTLEEAATGPMSDLLHNLLRQVTYLEQSTPTVMATDYQALQMRLTELEKDHSRQTTQYLNLVELRATDLENLIKVRDLLARERRDHDAMKQLRDDDLQNVLVLRDKLATANYKLSRAGFATSPSGPGSVGGAGPAPGNGNLSPTSATTAGARLSMKQSDYLWQVARTAAMEQRVLELESANKELRDQVAKSTAAATVAAANMSSALVPTSTSSSGMLNSPSILADGQVIARIENMFEDSLRQREKTATKMQALRSEKEALQKEVVALEDRNTELEAVVERLQRNLRV